MEKIKYTSEKMKDAAGRLGFENFDLPRNNLEDEIEDSWTAVRDTNGAKEYISHYSTKEGQRFVAGKMLETDLARFPIYNNQEMSQEKQLIQKAIKENREKETVSDSLRGNLIKRTVVNPIYNAAAAYFITSIINKGFNPQSMDIYDAIIGTSLFVSYSILAELHDRGSGKRTIKRECNLSGRKPILHDKDVKHFLETKLNQ